MHKLIGIVLITILTLINFSYGQETNTNEGVKRTGGRYANLFRFEFKLGKTDEGLDILNATLIPAFKNAEVEVTIIEDLMGSKDLFALIELKDGPSFYEYTFPKQDMDLFTELLKLSGSEQEAEKRLDKFIDLLVRQTQTLVYIRDER